MEDKDTLTKILIFLALLLATPFFVFGYDDETTHPALTQEIITFFNLKFPEETISALDAEHVIQGSIDEDKDGRWTRHFYDPVRNRGLSYLGTQWQSARDWAGDTLVQATFRIQDLPNRTLYGKVKDAFTGETDYSWERGIYEYAWGDKERGLQALGHTLHLIEDMSVPDHTRNDPHPGMGKRLNLPFLEHHNISNSSPYESFAVFKRDTLHIAETLIDKNPVIRSSIDEYMDSMARYSNEGFFSEDTIFDSKYENPKEAFTKIEKVSSDISLRFGYNKEGSRIVVYAPDFIWKEIGDGKKYTVDDSRILNDYFSRLSRQSILHGSGVISLFFNEVEKERDDKALYTKNRSWLGKKVDGFKKNAFGFASALYGSSVTPNDLEEDARPANPEAPRAEKPKQIDTPLKVAFSEVSSPKSESPSASAAVLGNPVSKSEALSQEERPRIAATSTIPDPAGIPATTASSSPPDTPPPPSAVATHNAEVVQTSASVPPPSVNLSIAECNDSLSSAGSGCLIATTSITLSWLTTSGTAQYYSLTCTVSGSACTGFSTSTTTATTTVYTLPSDSRIYSFTAKGYDSTETAGAQATQSVEVATRPLVINEIAWAGTSSTRSADEWIELYNPTGKTISLTGWVLRSTDNSPSVSLSSSIPSRGFFLLERTDDAVISDISAHQTYTGGLNNTGEQLILSHASTTMDQTPAVNACGSNVWCYGDSGSYKTMERFDPASSGTDTSNWGTFSGLLPNGSNADSVAISGTPAKRNSIHYAPANAALTANTTLTTTRSPYIITGTFTVPNNITLTLDPGVIIKMYNTSSVFTVNGSIMAGGTSTAPVVFTSFHDDDCGITGGCRDTNVNASATAPAGGDWASVKVSSTAASSTFSYTTFRYGGLEDASSAHWANLRIENASTTIRDSIIEKSRTYGIWLKNASGGVIAQNTIRENNRTIAGQTPGTGIVSTASNAAITGNAFTQNTKGLVIESGGTFSVSSNSFIQHTSSALEVSNSYPVFSGNTASSNRFNGVIIQNSQTQNYTLGTDLPSIISGTYTIQSGTTLTVPAGAVVKFATTTPSILSVAGTLVAAGASASRAVFTSLHDDAYGGDTNNDGSSSSPSAGDWKYISFTQNLSTSTLSYAIIRYGGDKTVSTDDGAVRISGASPEIRNTTVSSNYGIGIWMSHSTSTVIADSIIEEHRDSTSETFYGLFLSTSSTPTVSNTVFRTNEIHIFTDSTSTTTDGGGNTFE